MKMQLHQKRAEGQPEPVRTVDALGNVHYDDNQVYGATGLGEP